MWEKLRDILFYALVFSLIFANIPVEVQLPKFISGGMQRQLCLYFLLCLLVTSLYYQKRGIPIFSAGREFTHYYWIYTGVLSVSVIVGAIFFPYYSEAVQGPVSQIPQFPSFVRILDVTGLNLNPEFAVGSFISIKYIWASIVNGLYTFGGAYLLYCCYKNDGKKAFQIMRNSVASASLFLVLFSVPEILYLLKNDAAENFLKVIIPYIHEVQVGGAGSAWPPLLWPGQMRSVFAEPSYLGIWTAFALPFIWSSFLLSKKTKYRILWWMLLVILCFFAFMTKARTAVALCIGEYGLLLMAALYFHNKEWVQKVALLCVAFMIAFALTISFTTVEKSMSSMSSDRSESIMQSSSQYLSNNLGSLAGTESRSNATRYSFAVADIYMGLDHPFLGVGYGFRSAYLPHYLPSFAYQSNEVKTLLAEQKVNGIFKSNFATLGEYTSRFSQSGLIGMLVFLFPVFLLVKKFYKSITAANEWKQQIYLITWGISFMGIMCSGLGDSLLVTYAFWLLMGIGFVLLKTDQIKDDI